MPQYEGKRYMVKPECPPRLKGSSLSTDDAIILLLSATGPSGRRNEAVVGLTRLNKELFLLQEEGGVKLGITFEPKYYGPYSAEISESAQRLKDGLFISVAMYDTQYSNAVEIYSLTPRGIIRATRLYDRLESQDKNAFNLIKSKYNGKNLENLLDYVHTKYPQYRLTVS